MVGRIQEPREGIPSAIINLQRGWLSDQIRNESIRIACAVAFRNRQTKYVGRIESGETSKQPEQGLALQVGRLLGGDDEMRMTRLWRQVQYKTKGLIVSTSGLVNKGQSETSISIDSADLLTEAERFLRFVVDYLDRTKARILPNQTMNYGYWLVKFEPAGHDALDVWEYDPELDHFLHGGSLSLRYWRDQQAVCETFQAAFDPPNPGKLTSISDGVLEGQPVQAVRYNFGDPMSGWLIVTEQYNGDIKSLTNHHTYHVTAARPDLAKFLALPCGFRFDQTNGEMAWFDPEAAATQFPE